MKSSKLSWKIYYGTSEGKPKQRYETIRNLYLMKNKEQIYRTVEVILEA